MSGKVPDDWEENDGDGEENSFMFLLGATLLPGLTLLLLAALTISLCGCEEPKKWYDVSGRCVDVLGHWKCTQDHQETTHPLQKYKTPNEFTMADSCRIMVDSGAFWLWDHTDDHQGWYYPANRALNDWSKRCSEAKEWYREEEIVKARYK